MVLRYYQNSKIEERFIGFFNLQNEAKQHQGDEPSITGQVLGKTVVSICEKIGLPLVKCASVGTDGASVLMSKEKGAVRYIKSQCNSFTTHSYCLSHLLNLCISHCTNICEAEYVVAFINKTTSFFK